MLGEIGAWAGWLAASLSVLAMAGGYPCCCSIVPASSRYGARGNCFCCGPGYYDYQDPPGGPLEWKLTVGSITGTCLGASCAAASGTWYATYVSGCTWRSPFVDLCGTTNCIAWFVTIGSYPNCDPNPAAAGEMRLALHDTCSGTEIGRFDNPADATLTCNAPNTLDFFSSIACTFPASATAEPNYV